MDNIQTKEERMNRIKGSVIGYAVGDAIGALTEFMTPGEIRKKYGKVTEMLPGGWIKGRIAGETTDDTAIMKAVLSSLAASNGVPDYKDMADRLLAWLDTGPKDVGMACRRVMWSSNNGHFAKPLFSGDMYLHILWD
jgi:ADP-ribosyl-[dinitrogen reductase] hydrolase